MDNKTRLLMSCLQDVDDQVCVHALLGLSGNSSPEVFEAVLGVCRKRKSVSGNAATALRSMMSPGRVPRIMECLKEDEEMQLLAVGLLSHVVSPEATRALISTLNGKYDMIVKLEAMSGLAQHIKCYAETGDSNGELMGEAVRALCQALSSRQEIVRGEAVRCLRNILRYIAPHLIDVAKETQDENILQHITLLLGASDDEKVIQFLMSLSSHNSALVRTAAANAVGEYVSRMSSRQDKEE